MSVHYVVFPFSWEAIVQPGLMEHRRFAPEPRQMAAVLHLLLSAGPH